MKPTTVLAEATTPDGGQLVLSEHDGSYAIRLDGQGLMDSRMSESEIVLGQVGTAKLAGRTDGRILIGGLGLGYTLASVLDCVGPGATVVVAELLEPVVKWNREFLHFINGKAMDDPRVSIQVGDVFDVMKKNAKDGFDVILMDVDNGPNAMVQSANSRFYSKAGLLTIAGALTKKGRLVTWSAGDDDAFARRLKQSGFTVEVVRAKRYPGARKPAISLYVADK